MNPAAIGDWFVNPTPLVSTFVLLFKATAILLAAVVIATALRRASAGIKHVVWLVALGAVLVLPALAIGTPLRLPILPALAEPTVGVNALESPLSPIDGAAVPITSDVASPSAPNPAVRVLPSLATLLLIAWGTVAALLLARLVHGTLAVRRIVRTSRPISDRAWQARLYEIADRLAIRNAPRVVISDQIHVPFATGLINATIVLPAECIDWTDGQRDAVLVHELGHVHRHDLLGHTLGRVACAVYWFHPLVWIAARKLRDASERACDDLALNLGSRPSEYAGHLLQLVTAVGRPAVPSVALAMAQRKEFEGRMLAILDPALNRKSTPRWQTVSITGALAVVSVLVAAAAPAPKQSVDVPPTAPTSEGVQQPPKEPVAVSQKSPEAAPAQRGAELPVTATDPVEAVRAVTADTGRPDLLIQVLRNDSSGTVRRVAAWGLRRHAQVSGVNDALRSAARRDADADVRTMAVWALEDSHDRGTITLLGEVLRNDSSSEVREMAAWALGQLGEPSGAAFLIAQLASEQSPEVLGTLAWAIGSIPPTDAPPRLASLLTSEDRDTRLKAAWALSEIADAASLPLLRTALKQPQSRGTTRALLRAMVAIDQGAGEMAELINSPDSLVRQVAVEALAGNRRVDPWPWPWPRVIVSP